MLVAVAMAAVFAAMCLITASALGRHLFSFPIKGSEVVVGLFLAPIITYLALSSALAERDHVAVTLLVTRMGRRLRRFSQIFAALIVAGSFGLLAYEGWLRTAKAISDHQIETNLGWPLFWAYGAVPVGAGLLALRALALAFQWSVSSDWNISLGKADSEGGELLTEQDSTAQDDDPTTPTERS